MRWVIAAGGAIGCLWLGSAPVFGDVVEVSVTAVSEAVEIASGDGWCAVDLALPEAVQAENAVIDEALLEFSYSEAPSGSEHVIDVHPIQVAREGGIDVEFFQMEGSIGDLAASWEITPRDWELSGGVVRLDVTGWVKEVLEALTPNRGLAIHLTSENADWNTLVVGLTSAVLRVRYAAAP